MRWFAALLILIPVTAFADQAPARTKVNAKCMQYRMCDAEGDTGVCLGDAAQEIVLHVGQYADYIFDSVQSVGSYTCNIFTNNQGHDAQATNDQVNTTSITDEEPIYTMRVLLRYLWINCSEIVTTVTIDVLVCPR